MKNPGVLIMYLALRHNNARDFDDKKKKTHELSNLGTIQLHHIFPYDFMLNSDEMQTFRKKKKLTKQEFKTDVNDIANITFISLDANQEIKKDPPNLYLANFATNENLAAHCIPLDKELWNPENYYEFLEERRKLLAKAANEYFKTLN
jgi:hypothetical protein